MKLSGHEIALATAGTWHGAAPESIGSIETDSRSFAAGQAFLALRGPNHDGHRYGETVADRAVALIGDAEGMQLWSGLNKPKLEVADTLQALGDIAHAWRRTLGGVSVVAITGSYGKTSMRSLLETGFAGLGLKVAATRANLNNLIGVPKTLLAVPDDADVAIVECGISEQGEMARLAAMVAPDVAVITGLTAAHGEGLGGFAGVVQEKSLLLGSLNRGGWAALGEGVVPLLEGEGIALPGDMLAAGDVRWQLDDRTLQLSWRGESVSHELALPARHWAANIAFAASILLRFQEKRGETPSLSETMQALAAWQAPAGRMCSLRSAGGALLLDDSYNANPVSMQAAIDTLRGVEGRRIAVLGDMGELGADSEAGHAGLDISGLDQVWLVGERMKALAARHADANWLADTDAAVAALANESFDGGDTVLIKASRSMRLDRVVAALAAGQEGDNAL